MKPGDVRRAAAFLLKDEEVGDIFLDGKTYDVNVWSMPETRHSLTDIENLLIDTPSSERVRLTNMADVRIGAVPNVIEREGQSRKIDVSRNVKGRDPASVVADVEAAIGNIDFPIGFHTEVLGEFAERDTAQKNLFLAGSLAVLTIFFLRELALGCINLLQPAVGVGRRLAGSVLSQEYDPYFSKMYPIP